MQKQTQRREGQASTRSLPHHRVTHKGDRSLNKKQDPPDQAVTRFLQIFDQFKPHIIWVAIVSIAIYDYFRSSDVVGFLVLIAAAAGYISLRQAIDLLLGRSSSPPLAESQLEEGTTEDEAESTE